MKFKRKEKDKADNTRRKHVLPDAMKPTMWKPGVSPNPLGRPKGSRNKFGEAFLEDFLAEWEENGKAALRACRIEDPARFCSIAASLLPKELSIKEGEGAFDRLIEQFTDEQLEQFINGLIAFGAKQIEGSTTKALPGKKPNGVY